MKPTRSQEKHLRTYFRGIRHGNKCSKCKVPGQIINITENIIELKCNNCDRTWGHEPETTVSKTIEKMMFLD